MRLIHALLSLALGACAVPAAAQVYVSPVQLVDGNGDGKIKLTSARGPYKRGQTIVFCPEAAPFTYVRGMACPAVTPPPPPPPPPEPEPEPDVEPTPAPAQVKTGVNATGELFLEGRRLGIGINSRGALGTLKDAPEGFTTDLPTGLKRVGLFPLWGGLHDALLQGRAIEGFHIGYRTGGKTFVHSNAPLTGYNEIAGTQSAALSNVGGVASWTGDTAEALRVEQRITLAADAEHVRVDVVLTNRGTATLSDLRYMRSFDPDQSDLYATANRIERQGGGEALVTAGLPKSTSSFFLHARDPRAVASFYGFVNTDPYAALAHATPQPAGTARFVDQTLNLTFALGDLAPGRSVGLTLYMGVTADLPATLATIGGER